jgi:hypothetical protein
MGKGHKGEIDTDDVSGMITKWASIPFGIVVVLVSGSAINLVPYFLELKDVLGFSPLHQELIRWGVLLGYNGGILSGPIVNVLGTTWSFLITAFVAGAGYTALAFFSTSESIGEFNAFLVVGLVSLVAFAASMAYITAIATIIKNFSNNVGALVASVMIAYYFSAPYFDTSIRNGYFSELGVFTSLIASAVINFVVLIMASIVIDENEQSPQLKKASSITDRFGVAIYAGISAAFLATIYFTCIIGKSYQLGIVLITMVILANFVALGFTVQALIGRIQNEDPSQVADDHNPNKRNFFQCFVDVRFWVLVIGTFTVIGSGTMYYLEASDVAIALGNEELQDAIDYTFWLSAAIAILGGGSAAALFNHVINGWFFASVAAFSSAVGFALTFLSVSYPSFFYFSAFFVGAGVGGWYVIVPQLVLDDAGPRSFEAVWGATLTFNVLGMFAFERFFYYMAGKTEQSDTGTCEGMDCYSVSFIVAASLLFIVGILSIVAWNFDEGTAGRRAKRSGKNQPLSHKDSNKDARRSTSKDKKSSSKDKKSKSKSKPKSSSKTRRGK